MPIENPYDPPKSEASVLGSVRLTNYNLAGGPFLFAVLVGPLLLGFMLWSSLQNWSRLSDAEHGRRILWPTILGAAELAAVVYSIRVPIWWVEIGPMLRYAKLLRVYEVPWANVQRIWWDLHNERGPMFIKFATHHALIMRLDDYNDIKVLVPGDKRDQVNAIVSRHLQFKNSPFDDDESESRNGDDFDS